MVTVARSLDGSERCIGIDVASTGAVLQFRHRIFHRRCTAVLCMRTTRVAIGMAAGTVGSISRIRPSRRVGVGGMATGAG